LRELAAPGIVSERPCENICKPKCSAACAPAEEGRQSAASEDLPRPSQNKDACSRNVMPGTKHPRAAVVCVVGKIAYAWTQGTAISSPAAAVRNPWQGVAPESWAMGTFGPASRTSLGATLLVSRRPRDRVGFRGAATSTRDISANGMFIEAADPLWIGAGFTARLNSKQPLTVDCSVKRIEPGRAWAFPWLSPNPKASESTRNFFPRSPSHTLIAIYTRVESCLMGL